MTRAYARDDDGNETDITEGIQALYDLAVHSTDFGSGFWTYEDALPVAEIGRVMGFKKIGEVERYLAQEKHWEEQREFWRANPRTASNIPGWAPPPHDHVYSTSIGQCMWPRCEAKQHPAEHVGEQAEDDTKARDAAIERARQRAENRLFPDVAP